MLSLGTVVCRVIALGAAALLYGCAADVRNAVPLPMANTVQVAGFGPIRGWGDIEIPNVERIAALRFDQIKSQRPQVLKSRRRIVSYLAISGGGADGAYSAGFLNGWTASGKRPQFEVVSGVSAGALIAPFAFLGPAYDSKLKEIYTLYATDDLIQKQVLVGLFGGNAVSSTKPLANLIAKYITPSVMAAIAREHRKGRRLLVGTTNADQERPVVWDMGRIAERGTPEALRLFRRVLLASTALPGLFPPVYVNVTNGDGKVYQEMHIDGGVTENAFLLPLHFNLKRIDRQYGVRWRRRLYVLANSKTTPSPKVVEGTTFAIAGRSINTLIRQQLEGDLLKLYLRAKENNIAFRLASIPSDFTAESKEPFDREYMAKLYETGYRLARNGYEWQRKPPGL